MYEVISTYHTLRSCIYSITIIIIFRYIIVRYLLLWNSNQSSFDNINHFFIKTEVGGRGSLSYNSIRSLRTIKKKVERLTLTFFTCSTLFILYVIKASVLSCFLNRLLLFTLRVWAFLSV